MLFTHAAAWLIAAVVSAPGASQGPAPSPVAALVTFRGPTLTLRKRVEEVRVTFAVRHGHRLVKDLRQQQLTIRDNGQQPSAITAFEENSSLPLHIALVIDRSDSMQKGFAAEQRAAQEFLKRFLRPGVDSVFVVDFAGDVTVSRPLLKNATLDVAGAMPAAGQTSLYDAIAVAGQGFGATQYFSPVRRIIILLSDGEDNYSRSTMEQAIKAAQRADAAIYALTAHTSHYEYQGDSVLRSITKETGGRAFILKSYDRAGPVFSEIENELRTQYSLSFRPPAGGNCGYHRIEVVTGDPKLRVQARSGYYACSE